MSKSQCRGKTATGAACRAPAGPSGFCYFHANPEKARSLGQIGGRKNRTRVPESFSVRVSSAVGLRDVLAEAIDDVRSKKMPPRTAGAIAQLSNSLCRVLPIADLEARLARLEQQLAEQENHTPVDTDETRSRERQETCDRADAQPGDAHTPGDGDEADGGSDGPDEEGKA
jgi:hypothetical protein